MSRHSHGTRGVDGWTVQRAHDALTPASREPDGWDDYAHQPDNGPPILHGYTQDDITRAAGTAVGQCHRDVYQIQQPRQTAADGIIDLLLSREPDPDVPWPWRYGQLVQAGYAAIQEEIRANRKHRGIPYKGTVDYGIAPGRDRRHKFLTFWLDWHQHTQPSAPDGVVDRLALHQVLAQMPPRLQRFCLLISAGAPVLIAGEAVGAGSETATRRLVRQARDRIDSEWSGRTPTRRQGTATVCLRGHVKDVRTTNGLLRCSTCVRQSQSRYNRRSRTAHRLFDEASR